MKNDGKKQENMEKMDENWGYTKINIYISISIDKYP